MSNWIDKLPTAAQTYLQNRRLDEVECIISDLPGVARGKAVPASKFARQTSFHLPDSIFYQTITGDWGEAAGDEGFIERDMVLRPDMPLQVRPPGPPIGRCRSFMTPMTETAWQFHIRHAMCLNGSLNCIMIAVGNRLWRQRWNFFW